MNDVEEMISELQNSNQQLQTIVMQKQALMIQNKEAEKALEEIEKCRDEDIYKSVGPILVRTSKETMKKELLEEREETELKLKSLEKQETRIRQKMKTIQEKFQSMAGPAAG